jgi:hypothetical protein
MFKVNEVKSAREMASFPGYEGCCEPLKRIAFNEYLKKIYHVKINYKYVRCFI